MAEDVNVKEIDVLNAYGRKLHELRGSSIAVAVLLDRQLRKIQEDYASLSNTLRNIQRNCEDACMTLQDRYQRAVTDCGEESREVIGNTDLEAQMKLEALHMKAEMMKSNIQRLQNLLQNAGNKTKNYALQMDNMTDNCISIIKRQSTLLEKYKDLKK